jgi:hypothetical protein
VRAEAPCKGTDLRDSPAQTKISTPCPIDTKNGNSMMQNEYAKGLKGPEVYSRRDGGVKCGGLGDWASVTGGAMEEILVGFTLGQTAHLSRADVCPSTPTDFFFPFHSFSSDVPGR